MFVEITKETEVAAPPEVAWELIGDVPRLSACIPGVSDVRELEPGKRYSGTITDKLGPFRVELPLEIAIQGFEPPNRLMAELIGNDARGQARVKGNVEAHLERSGGRTKIRVDARLEVVGKLAALGATPLRRRADDIFAEFVRRVAATLAA